MDRTVTNTPKKTGSEQEASDLVERAYSVSDPDEAKELYRDWAESYDASMVDGLAYLTPSRTAEMLARHLADHEAPVLDVGCGTGLAGAALRAHGFSEIDAIDFSPEMLAVAGRRGIYGRLVEADLTKSLPIADAAYSAWICTGTFTHAHVGADCLDELLRILRPGGLLACTVHNDVWEPMGFAAKFASLTASGALSEVENVQGPYYETDTEPEGRYLTYRRA